MKVGGELASPFCRSGKFWSDATMDANPCKPYPARNQDMIGTTRSSDALPLPQLYRHAGVMRAGSSKP
jgi:hypothetical protein